MKWLSTVLVSLCPWGVRFMPKAKNKNATPKPEDGFVGTGDVQT